ncbi:uncharacterized protein [Nicotiana tomentosiformis]|uniref:uncharacterized protein n=1 Tax=Nicotiana tomentosiformis TaxID=4098 RepID=UPI00388C832D
MANNQNTRSTRSLPSDTEKNPQINAVTLRNGRELVEVPKKQNESSGLEEERVPKPVEVDEKNKTGSEHISERVPPPFPQRLRKKNYDHIFHKFLDMLKHIHLNIPLVDMLLQLSRHYEDLAMISVVEINEPAVEPSAFNEDELEKALILFNYLELEEEEEKLLRALREHKHAIGWTMSDIKGISPAFCMHKILMEEGHKPSEEHQHPLNPIMKEVARKEEIKWLDACIVFPISDRLTGWRICIDYKKLNNATRKDHFLLPFIDQILDRLVGQEYYCFLDGYSGYNQISIALEDQEKTIFTCPYGTYTFKRMPFRLLLAMCEETNLVLNCEKCHFMVHEGIVLGYKVSKDVLEVDKAKVEAIEKLLEKYVSFKFEDTCLKAFEELKKKLVSALIIVAPADYLNYLASGEMPPDLEPHAKKKFLLDVKSYMWYESFLFKSCTDQLMRRYVPESEINAILHDCHALPMVVIMRVKKR